MPATRIYWLHTLSPTHAGIGQGVGYIDLPIDRDGVTNWPLLRGSGFKGVLADHHRATTAARRDNELLRYAFGVSGDEPNSNSGTLIPTDARLVCLPVRSFRGTFAWATSPLCLSLLHRTLRLAGVQDVPTAPGQLADANAHHASGTALVEGTTIYLEDLNFTAQLCQTATKWAERIAAWVFPNDASWQAQFKKRFVVLPDAAFDFLCETGTEVHTRVRLDDCKTVADGALWTEESLPAETILMGLIQCERVFGSTRVTAADLLREFTEKELVLQVGGKATVGRGQVRCVFAAPNGGAA